MKKLPKFKKGDLVVIRWTDHAYYSGWKVPEHKTTACTCESTGYVHEQDAEKLTIAQSVSWDLHEPRPKDYMQLNCASGHTVIVAKLITDWWKVHG